MSTIGNFWCQSCTCGRTGKDRDVTLEYGANEDPDSIICPNAGDRNPNRAGPLKGGACLLKHLGDRCGAALADPAHKKGRKPTERRARADNDFKKNILPTLAPSDQKQFVKKHGRV